MGMISHTLMVGKYQKFNIYLYNISFTNSNAVTYENSFSLEAAKYRNTVIGLIVQNIGKYRELIGLEGR